MTKVLSRKGLIPGAHLSNDCFIIESDKVSDKYSLLHEMFIVGKLLL